MDTSAITGTIVEGLVSQPHNQEPPVEAQPVEDIVKDDELSKRIAVLAKKDKAILDQQRALQQKMKELEEREAKLAKYSKFDEINDENAIDFIREKGLSIEKIQEKWLSQLGDDDIDPVQKQFKELKAQLAKKDEEYKKLVEEKFSERERIEQEQKIEEQSKFYNEELKKYLSDNADKYDLINTFESSDEVFKVIKDVYTKTYESGNPKLLTFDEAANLYEEKLAELVKGMSKSKKVMQLLGATSSEDDIAAQLFGQKTIDDSFTLTSSKSADGLTQAEREKQAAKMFEQMIKGA